MCNKKEIDYYHHFTIDATLAVCSSKKNNVSPYFSHIECCHLKKNSTSLVDGLEFRNTAKNLEI